MDCGAVDVRREILAVGRLDVDIVKLYAGARDSVRAVDPDALLAGGGAFDIYKLHVRNGHSRGVSAAAFRDATVAVELRQEERR